MPCPLCRKARRSRTPAAPASGAGASAAPGARRMRTERDRRWDHLRKVHAITACDWCAELVRVATFPVHVAACSAGRRGSPQGAPLAPSAALPGAAVGEVPAGALSSLMLNALVGAGGVVDALDMKLQVKQQQQQQQQHPQQQHQQQQHQHQHEQLYAYQMAAAQQLEVRHAGSSALMAATAACGLGRCWHY
jgi:hypothetical protein